MRLRAVLYTCLMIVSGLAVMSGAGLSRHAAAQGADWIGADINGLHYEVLLPDHYESASRYPVVLYLHQLDMGSYREGLMQQVNGWFNTRAFRSRHPCIVVMPMLDQTNDKGGKLINFGGKSDGHIGEDNAIAALKQATVRYSVDTNRIYVTGNSMGGMGTWQMLLDYNALTGTKDRIFAAGMPLAGAQRTADPAEAARVLRQVPIWAIHGAHDKEVGLDWDRSMARLMAKNATFRYTEVPNGGHNIWDTYYTRSDVWDWLFSQSGKA